MKNLSFVLLIAVILSATSAHAQDDVYINSGGNVETGVSNPLDGSGTGNLDVVGASGENAIRGYSSGTGAGGVYGVNTDNNSHGYLGHYNGDIENCSDHDVVNIPDAALKTAGGMAEKN